jgi:arylsulfatase A
MRIGFPLLLTAACGVMSPLAAAAAPRPNIVFILADDLGYGDVRALNPQGKIATPQLDRLAASGMTFTEAHASSAVCTPSRYSILTGRYNWRSTLKQGVLGGFSPPLIEEGRLTVAEFLRRQGYHTAAIGKWHLGLGWTHRAGAGTAVKVEDGDNAKANAGRVIDFTRAITRAPTTLGFDEFFGISASLDMPPYAYIENDRVTVVPTAEKSFPWIAGVVTDRHTRVGPAAAGFDVTDVLPTFTRRAVDTIAQRAAEARAGKPFFLYLPLNSPHTPIAPTPEWRGKSGLNAYADFVMETDAAIGDVLAALEKNGVADNTLVIFASDNGCSPEADYPFLTSHAHDPSAGRRGYKADIFDGGHRIPLLVRWPGHVNAGARSDGFVCLGDFMATCAEMLGATLPANAAEDSVSFLPLLQEPNAPAPRTTLVMHSINGSFAIRDGRWKLELCPDSGGWSFPRPGRDRTADLPRFQLYDLATDPAEKTNVVAEHADVVRRLGHALREQIVNGRSTAGAPQPNDAVARWPQTAWLDEFK